MTFGGLKTRMPGSRANGQVFCKVVKRVEFKGHFI